MQSEIVHIGAFKDEGPLTYEEPSYMDYSLFMRCLCSFDWFCYE